MSGFLLNNGEVLPYLGYPTAASQAIKPGHLLKLNSALKFTKWDQYGAKPTPIIMADREGFQNDLETYASLTAFGDGTHVTARVLWPGTRVNLWVAPSQTIAVGDYVQADNGGLVVETNRGFQTGLSQGVPTTVAFDDLTDGGSTAGTITLTGLIPAGAVPAYMEVTVGAGFTGDSSATLQIGVSGDADAFSVVTSNSIFAAGQFIATPTNEGADLYNASAATDVLLTVTSGSDFTSVSAGSLVITPYYTFLGGNPLALALEAKTTDASTTSRAKFMII